MGKVHDIVQGKGGEQGDPLVPALFALGQHEALQAISRGLLPSEKLFAFLDNIFIGVAPERLAILHRLVETALWDHARIRINQGKTQIWNRAGVFPAGCEHIVEAGRRASPPVVWRRDQSLPTSEQGIRVLGIPFGHSDHVTAELRSSNEEHSTWLSRILAVRDLQCAWLLLLFCAAARASYLLRVLPPSQSETFATVHDSSVWNCLRQLLDIPGTPEMLDRAGLSLTNGGVGLAERSEGQGQCVLGKLADVLPTIRELHPAIADQLCVALQRGDRGLHISAAAQCREQLIASGYGCLNGGTSPGVSDQDSFQLTTACLGSARGGNEVWQRTSMMHSVQGLCGHDCTPTSRRSSVPKVARWHVYHSAPSMVECDSVRTPGVPCAAPQTPLVPFTPVRVKLPVWPSIQSKWPPPRILSARRSFGAKGVPSGERRSTCL